MIQNVIAIIGVTFTALIILGGLAVFVLRSVIAPLNVALENNTNALNRITDIIDDHTIRLDDHGNRLTKIETVHEMEARS